MYGKQILFSLVTISPNIDPKNLTEYLHLDECDWQKSPPLNIPEINTDDKPVENNLPERWSATILVHPFSEPQEVGPESDYPFFQLSYGRISYDSVLGEMLVYVTGCTEGGEWWFKITRENSKNYISRNASVASEDVKWREVDLGWSFPSRNWTEPGDKYVGHSPLNWMNGDVDVDWWKKNYRNTSTWSWYDRKNGGFPFRLMFSAPPPSNFKGERDNLAFFQMYAFSYLVNPQPESVELSQLHKISPESSSVMQQETGFTCGNLDQYPVFNWTNHFAVSAFMIPVDFPHNPYPTKVYYRWTGDGSDMYTGNPFDRSQSTVFYNNYNSFEHLSLIRADLFGHWGNTSAPTSQQQIKGAGFLTKTSMEDWQTTCETMLADEMPIAQQPPWWPSLGSAQIIGTIKRPHNASDSWVSPLTGSNRTVAVIRVTFPPHLPNYPTSTSLWTWYDYTEFVGEDKGPARPIAFMQSAPNFNLGTSLALADFFSFRSLPDTINYRTPFELNTLRNYCDGFTL